MEGGEGSAASSREAVEALQAAEIPEAGFPSDRSNDAERVRPGLADFARGA